MENLQEEVLKSLQKIFTQKEIILPKNPENFPESFWTLLNNVNIQEAIAQAIWEQQNPTKVRSSNHPVNAGIH